MNAVQPDPGAAGAVVWPQRRAAVIEAARHVPAIDAVERVDALDAGAFREAARRGVPFVLLGIVERWPISVFTPADLKSVYGSLRVEARIGDYVSSAFTRERSMRRMSLARYLDQVRAPSGGLPPYVGNQDIPPLGALCYWPAYYTAYRKARIWLGPAGTVTPLHCDFTDNLFAQIWGRKRFRLYPPHHKPFLYTWQVNRALFGAKFDPEAPDYGKHPLARQAQEVQCELQPGELLFLPSGWFHHVRSLEFSLSANRWAEDLPMALQH